MSSNEAAALGGIIGASIMMFFLIGLAVFVLTVIARWKIFTKAGEAGWKSIIPIYSDYIEWKISWNNIMMFWVCLALIVVGYILGMVGGTFIVTADGQIASGTGGFMGVLSWLLMVAGVVLACIQKFKLFKSFGKGVGWFIAYLFFQTIVTLVLGFGSAQYQGPQD